jgi:hypothetical protein
MTVAALMNLAVWTLAYSQTTPARIDIPNSPIPIQVLVQSPADTETDLQVICLFRSSATNTLHGSLIEMNGKLKGLLDRIRKPELFRGELGETLLLTPSKGSLGARRLLIIGLGDSETFLPERMQLVGEILYNETSRLGVTHPFFAPTIIDGGVTRFTTGEVSKEVIAGFLRAGAIAGFLQTAHASADPAVAGLTYLAGTQHADDTRDGIEKAITAALKK